MAQNISSNSTLVVGASLKPERTSNQAIHMLREANEPVLAFGLRGGEVADVSIQTDRTTIQPETVDTVTLYLGAKNQPDLYDWIVSLTPRRVIFNPGAENPEFAQILSEKGIQPIMACTLVMVRTGQY